MMYPFTVIQENTAAAALERSYKCRMLFFVRITFLLLHVGLGCCSNIRLIALRLF